MSLSIPRHLRAVSAAVLLLPALAACGDGTTSESVTEGGGVFPLTVEHEFGSTTIEQEPERIVTLGVIDADIVIALGTVPVGNTGYTFFENGLGPWTDDLVEGEEMTFIESDSEPSLEQVASLEPDLILGISAGFDEAAYESLSDIAPVVARPAGSVAYTVSRDDSIEIIAEAMGRPDDGRRLIEETNALLATVRDEHPAFSQSTGVAVLPYEGKYGAFLPGDARGQFLDDLGFALPDAVSDRDTGDSFFVELSRENVGALDGDLLLVLTDDEDLDVAQENSLFESLDVVRNDAVVVATIEQRGAITYNSPLSLPYAVETLVPRIVAALS